MSKNIRTLMNKLKGKKKKDIFQELRDKKDRKERKKTTPTKKYRCFNCLEEIKTIRECPKCNHTEIKLWSDNVERTIADFKAQQKAVKTEMFNLVASSDMLSFEARLYTADRIRITFELRTGRKF